MNQYGALQINAPIGALFFSCFPAFLLALVGSEIKSQLRRKRGADQERVSQESIVASTRSCGTSTVCSRSQLPNTVEALHLLQERSRRE